MSNHPLELEVTDISDSLDGESCPDMIKFYIEKTFLVKAEKWLKFMNEEQIDVVTVWSFSGGPDFDMFKANEDGTGYETFEPSFRLDGHETRLYKDGDVKCKIFVKHSSETLWCTIGNIHDIHLSMDAVA